MILDGPPRDHYRADLTEEELSKARDRDISVRLMRLREGGLTLPEIARRHLEELLARHPEWSGPITERDEFVIWSGGSEWAAWPESEPRLDDYRGWSDERVLTDLRVGPNDPQVHARWRGLLLDDVQRAIRLLDRLATEGFFGARIWAIALEHLKGEQTTAECVRLYGTCGPNLGAEFISENTNGLTSVIDRYCRGQQKTQDDFLWRLWDLVLAPAIDKEEDAPPDPVFAAINVPIGYLTEALLIKLGELNPVAYDEIPAAMRDRLESLLAGPTAAHRLSRLLLAKALAWLYNLNPHLVETSFLPRFDWTDPVEARCVWSGYLMSPRVTLGLWTVFRSVFLAAIHHSGKLDRYEDQFYSLLAYLLLHEEFTFEAEQARSALTAASPRGRSQVAWYWWHQTHSATDYGASLFRDRLKHLLTVVWPLELELREPDSSENLAQLALNCGTEFEDAVATITPLLVRTAHPDMIILSLTQKGHADTYPAATLALLDSSIEQIEVWDWQSLKELLYRIGVAMPSLSTDPRFVRLSSLIQRFE